MTLAPALAELGLVVLILWIIAFVALIATIAGYVAGVLHGLPFPLNQLAGPVNSLASGLSHAVSFAFKGVDRLVAWTWHTCARLLDFTWHELLAAQGITQVTAENVRSHAVAINALAARWRTQRAQVTARTGQVKTLEREFHGIDERVREIERELHKGIGNDVRLHIKALERELGGITTQVDQVLAPAETATQSAVDNLYEWAKGKASLLGIGTFATAVATAIGLDVFKLLRCNELGNLAKNYGCNLWSRLAGLLPLLGLLTIAFDFEEFTDAAIVVANGIGDTVASIEGTFETSLPPLPPPA